MPERFALFYAPATSHPLWWRAAQWLGRDSAGTAVPPTDIPGIDTAQRLKAAESPRRYGFHATLKAPIALAPGTDRAALEAELSRFAPDARTATIGRLKVADLDGFVALVPELQSAELTGLVADIVAAFEPFRAPLDAATREKRIIEGRLNTRQIDYLDRYGYPYVMDEFRFHMTLTGRLGDAERPALLAAATNWFAPLLEESFVLDRIALSHEADAGAPFTRLADFPLRARVTADA